MNDHKLCNILGRYCWTHRVKVDHGIPYWPKSHKGGYTHYSIWEYSEITKKGYTECITWKNGDTETKRNLYSVCSLCGKHCKYPVNEGVTNSGDNYREIRKSMLS